MYYSVHTSIGYGLISISEAVNVLDPCVGQTPALATHPYVGHFFHQIRKKKWPSRGPAKKFWAEKVGWPKQGSGQRRGPTRYVGTYIHDAPDKELDKEDSSQEIGRHSQSVSKQFINGSDVLNLVQQSIRVVIHMYSFLGM